MGRMMPEDSGGSRFSGAQTWSAHRRAHNRLCRHDGHSAGAPVLADGWTNTRARAVVSCSRCGAYMASFEGPLTAVQTATAQWVHRAPD
jgi:hypothetical protein